MREAMYGGISRRSGAGQLPHSNLNVYRRHSDDRSDRRRPTVSWNVGRFHKAVKRHGLMINWTKQTPWWEPTECKVYISWGCTARTSKGDSVRT